MTSPRLARRPRKRCPCLLHAARRPISRVCMHLPSTAQTNTMSFVPASFRPALRQSLFRSSPISPRSLHTTPCLRTPNLPRHPALKRSVPDSIALARSLPSRQGGASGNKSSRSLLYALGLGTSFLAFSSTQRAPGQCQNAAVPTTASRGLGAGDPQPPQSILSVYELGFGTVAGICAGVFLKKGLRAIAFLLGGAFIFLQVSLSSSPIRGW